MFFFIANYIHSRVFRGFEQLSTVAQSDGEFLLAVECPQE